MPSWTASACGSSGSWPPRSRTIWETRCAAVGESAVRLDRIVAQAVALVDIDFHESAAPVNVRTSIPDLPALRGSVAELSLLFVNLLRNARDAMPEGGTVAVTARREKNALVVTVSDEGTGLP